MRAPRPFDNATPPTCCARARSYRPYSTPRPVPPLERATPPPLAKTVVLARFATDRALVTPSRVAMGRRPTPNHVPKPRKAQMLATGPHPVQPIAPALHRSSLRGITSSVSCFGLHDLQSCLPHDSASAHSIVHAY